MYKCEQSALFGCIRHSLLDIIFYMDDLIILASNVTLLALVKSKLEKEFEIKDLQELHYCIGIEFDKNREPRTIIKSQKNNIKEILKRFNMEKYKPIGSPFNVDSKLLKLSDEVMEGVLYKVGIGSLMYAMRADIAFAASTVSQFMSKAGPPHWMAAKCIMRYLKGTLDVKLYLGGFCFERFW